MLVSRAGNRFNAPAWFVVDFPPLTLDGELWMGRGTFEKLSSVVRRNKPDHAMWRQVRTCGYEANLGLAGPCALLRPCRISNCSLRHSGVPSCGAILW